MSKEPMNLTIDSSLKKQFRAACVIHDSNMSEVVAKLIALWLDKPGILEPQEVEPENTKPRRGRPRKKT